jgi:hypothetical protein
MPFNGPQLGVGNGAPLICYCDAATP